MFLKAIYVSNEVKNAKLLYDHLCDVLMELGLENEIQVVIENTANYILAGKLLYELFWIPC